MCFGAVTRPACRGGRSTSLGCVARRIGGWLDGPSEPLPKGHWPGRRLGLPESGPGAVASTGRRVLALLVDLAVGALIGALLNGLLTDPDAVQRSVSSNGAFAVQVIVLQALTGQSIGMRLAGIRVAHVRRLSVVPGFLPAAIRTGLLILVVPALITDRDGRGLHDRAAGTVVLRAGEQTG